MAWFADLKRRARHLKAETQALVLAMRAPGTPWYAKVLVAGVVAYAFSPIDLVPDFIPVVGHLDDLVLLPVGIALAIRLVPADVLAECRAQAAASKARPPSRVAAAVIVCLWVALTALCMLWGYRMVGASGGPFSAWG